MTFRNLFIFNAVICLFFGFPLVFAPKMVFEMYATDPTQLTEYTLLTGRVYGSLILSLGIALWSSRHAQPSLARRGLLWLVVVGSALLGIIHVYAIMSGITNYIDWSVVAIGFILASWGGILLSKEAGFELK